MAERRICPVCESEIPELNKFVCPKCYFDLSWMEDEKYIAEWKTKYIVERLKTIKKVKYETPSSSEPDKPMTCLPIIAGLIILIWWWNSWLVIDAMSELMCFFVILPGIVGLILVVVGIINLLVKKIDWRR